MQLAHPKVAKSKPEAIGPQVCLCWTVLASVKVNCKLILSASTLEQGDVEKYFARTHTHMVSLAVL